MTHSLQRNSFSEKRDVEHRNDSVQLPDRGRMGRALQGHVRIRLRFLEDSHVSLFGCRVSGTVGLTRNLITFVFEERCF